MPVLVASSCLQTCIAVQTVAHMRARDLLLLPAALLLAALVAGCGSNATLAKVGDRSITRTQVDALVAHGSEEAQRENRAFPARGSAEYRALQREALAILVSRAQIAQAAKRIGVTVSQQELDRLVTVRRPELVEALYEATRRQLGIAERNEKGESAQLLQDAVRVQLTLQRVEHRVGAPHLGAWVAAARRLPVRYAAGWAPAEGVE
jgi:hypothetical protein